MPPNKLKRSRTRSSQDQEALQGARHRQTPERTEERGREEGDRKGRKEGDKGMQMECSALFLEMLDELCSNQDLVGTVESVLNMEYLESLLSSDPEPIDPAEPEEEEEKVLPAEWQPTPQPPSSWGRCGSCGRFNSLVESLIDHFGVLMQAHQERRQLTQIPGAPPPQQVQLVQPVLPYAVFTAPSYHHTQNAPVLVLNGGAWRGPAAGFPALRPEMLQGAGFPPQVFPRVLLKGSEPQNPAFPTSNPP